MRFHTMYDIGIYAARCYRIAPNAFLGIVVTDIFGETDQGMFRSGIGSAGPAAKQAAYRGDIDNDACFLFQEYLNGAAAGIKRRVQINAHYFFP